MRKIKPKIKSLDKDGMSITYTHVPASRLGWHLLTINGEDYSTSRGGLFHGLGCNCFDTKKEMLTYCRTEIT